MSVVVIMQWYRVSPQTKLSPWAYFHVHRARTVLGMHWIGPQPCEQQVGPANMALASALHLCLPVWACHPGPWPMCARASVQGHVIWSSEPGILAMGGAGSVNCHHTLTAKLPDPTGALWAGSHGFIFYICLTGQALVGHPCYNAFQKYKPNIKSQYATVSVY